MYELPEDMTIKQSLKEALKSSSDKFSSLSNDLRELMYKTSCKTTLAESDMDSLFEKIKSLGNLLKTLRIKLIGKTGIK